MSTKAVWRGDVNQAICAFTFDDGPSRLPLELWLDVLEQEEVVGTFFFTGEWMDKHPDRAREVLSRGHVLAPHTYHHRRMAQVPKHVFLEQLKLTELAYQDATGLPCPNFMRFPYCSFREENLDWLAEWGGYLDIEGIDSRDWKGISAEDIVAQVQPGLENGTIVVQHSNDIAVGSPEALRQLIQIAKQRGLRGVGIPEILESIGVEVGYRPWKITVEVPAELDHPVDNWITLQDEEFAELAAQTVKWDIPEYTLQFNSKSEWLEHLKNPLEEFGITENRELFAIREFEGTYWGYVRAGVTEDSLVLLDYAAREAQADTLVYLLRWAAETASKLGLTQIEARRDIRKMNEMCRQLGWKSEITEDKSGNE
ncbi:polysaccharide deacetylase family protein [Paenibacillus anaericanus]|uniref:Polysaccharide deacetylase family protein n=1 Tax=Paenibacillus anaericanus TaxID=170367 RepID=A0A3S1DN72_9BACL|nr:polysaccharide deacetylase family protein [Paenibacillus anaericanus]RUT45222.1 polysaccharide deacetylase family protein [Paenibacillus anaericanus]